MRKAVRLGVRVLLGLVTLGVVGALFLAWRMDKEPIDLADFLPMVERALSPSSADATIEIGQLALARDGRMLMLQVGDVRAVDRTGAEIAMIPTARIQVSARALLNGGLLAPERIVVEGLALNSRIQEDGSIAIGMQKAQTGSASSESEIDTARLLALWDGEPRLQHLRQIDFEHANFSVVDSKRGLAWRAPNVAAVIAKSADGVTFRGGGLMRQQMLRGEEVDRALGKISWVMQAQRGTVAKQARPSDVALEVTLEQVDPIVLTGIVPPLVGERGLEAPISGTLTTSFQAGRIPGSAAFVLTLGEGKVTIPGNGSLGFDKVSMIGRVSRDEMSVQLDHFVLHYNGLEADSQLRLSGRAEQGANGDIAVTASVSGIRPAWLASLSSAFSSVSGADVSLSGETELVFDRDGGLRDGELHLNGGKAVITLPEVFEAPVTLAGLQAGVRLREYGAEWVLEGLGLAFEDGASIQITGTAHRGQDGGRADFAVTGKGFAVDTVKQFWPVPVSPPARGWVMKNIKSGSIPSLDATISADIGGIGTPLVLSGLEVDARMPVRDVTLTYWNPMPGASKIDADARITEKLFEATILHGETGGMTVTGGKILVTGIDKGKGHELLDLTIDADGPVSSLMTILDREPLGFAQFLNLRPRSLEGAVSGTLQVSFPPTAELVLDDVKISASGSSRNASLPGIAGGHDLSQANLEFTVDKEELRVKGKAAAAGTPLTLSAHMPFSDQAPYRGRYVLIGTLDNKGRERLGLDSLVLQPPFVDGPSGIVLTVTQRDDSKTYLDLEFDLSKAALSVAPAGWSKPKGGFAAGKARVLVKGGNLEAVESFQISGPGMRIAGSARFAASDGRPTVQLRQLKLGGGTDIRAAIRPLPDNGYEIELGKGRLDLRPMILASSKDSVGQKAAASNSLLRVKLSGPAVRVRDGPAFQDVQGGLLLRGENILEAELRGSPGGADPAVFRMTPDGTLQITAGDAGALLQTLGLPGRLDGGTFALNGTAAADLSIIDADMRVSDFTLVEAPVMMRVLQLASITGPLELLAGSSGLPMTAMEAPFTLKNKKLTVKNGRVYGGSLGVTFRGEIDLSNQSLDLNGAVVPVYVLNQLLSSVPLIGDVLTGGEGVFAVSYSVSGKYTDPQIAVNPLSLLAPGGLRRLLMD